MEIIIIYSLHYFLSVGYICCFYYIIPTYIWICWLGFC